MPQPAAITLDYSPADTTNVIAKIIRRLIPFLCFLFIVNYLDRTNVAMAKLRMQGDTHISEKAYGLGAGLFFIGYFIFEVPSNLILEKIGARRWIARIMITWGLISASMMFVRGPASFCWLRFALGVAEAGFFPGIVLYLTYWVPSAKRAKVLAAFLTSTAISGIVGNPLAGLLMKLEGLGHLHGWQWLFLIEGIVPVFIGFVVLALLPDKPAQAKWLSEQEKLWLDAELARDANHGQHHVAELAHALADHRLWLLSAIYFMLIMGLYGFIFWLPSIIKSTTEVSDLRIGLLSAIPYIIAAISMIFIAEHSDKHAERRWHVASSAIIAAIGVAAVAMLHTSIAVQLALSFAAIGIWGSLGPFWALSTRFLRGTAAAGGIAIVNSIGALAGFVAPYAIGISRMYGLLIVSASLLCGAILVLLVPRQVDQSN